MLPTDRFLDAVVSLAPGAGLSFTHRINNLLKKFGKGHLHKKTWETINTEKTRKTEKTEKTEKKVVEVYKVNFNHQSTLIINRL